MAVIACVLVIRPLLRGGVPGTYVPCSKEACRAISTTEWNKRESQLEDFSVISESSMKLAKKKGQEKKGNKEKRKKHRDDEDIFYAAIQLYELEHKCAICVGVPNNSPSPW